MRAGWMVVIGLVACGGPAKQVAQPQPIANEVKPAEPPPPVAVEAGSDEVHGGLLANDPSAPPPAEPAPTTVVTEDGTEGGAFASLTGTGDFSSGFDDANIYGGLTGDAVGEGTIGTIGHGSGTGVRGRKAVIPRITLGQIKANGDLDKAIIRRYVRRHLMRFAYCYEKQLMVEPKLKGKLLAEYTIGADGKVTAATSTGVDGVVAACVTKVLEQIEYPKPKGGGAVTVKLPLTFKSR